MVLTLKHTFFGQNRHLIRKKTSLREFLPRIWSGFDVGPLPLLSGVLLRPESGFGLRPFLENLQIFVCIYVYRGYRFTDDIYLRLPSLTMTTSSVRPELRTLSRSVFGRDEEFQ